MALNGVAKASGVRHVHGVNIHLAKQGHWGRDDRRYEDIMNLSKLARATSPDEPIYISAHKWPPEPQTDQGVSCIKAFVSYFIMHRVLRIANRVPGSATTLWQPCGSLRHNLPECKKKPIAYRTNVA